MAGVTIAGRVIKVSACERCCSTISLRKVITILLDYIKRTAKALVRKMVHASVICARPVTFE